MNSLSWNTFVIGNGDVRGKIDISVDYLTTIKIHLERILNFIRYERNEYRQKQSVNRGRRQSDNGRAYIENEERRISRYTEDGTSGQLQKAETITIREEVDKHILSFGASFLQWIKILIHNIPTL